MSDHLPAELMERYLRRALSPEELLRADDHIVACRACREGTAAAGPAEDTLVSFQANLPAEARAAKGDHLPYEEIAALVDGRLDPADREIAEGHLDLCQLCQEEVEDLRGFRASLVDAPGEARTHETFKPTVAQRPPSSPRWFAFSLPLQLAALALLAVSLMAWLLWARTRPVSEGTQTLRPPVTGPAPGASSAPAATSEKASAQIVVALDDSAGRVTLDAQGEIKGLEGLPLASQEAVKKALASGRLDTPDALAVLSRKPGTLMGGAGKGDTFSLSNPVGAIVRADRPDFRWRALPGASRYTVTVLDSDLRLVATSPSLVTTSWTPPSPFERGRIYMWQVSALKDGEEIISPAPPAPEARFKILERAIEQELTRAEESAGPSHLARGVLYARAGLIDEAERELRALVAANPDAPIAQKLLQSIQTRTP